MVVYSTTQLQVQCGDLESSAQVAEFLERRQPTPRQIGEVAIRGN
jgi:hypothetical protein